MARNNENFSKVTVNLPNEDVLRMSEMARRHALTKTAALVRALRLAQYIDDETAKGTKLFLQDTNGTLREIIIK
ncbi:hypothetical protein ACFW9U_17395 [Rhodococcus aetherivorans]|uniref:hypothetical protein n=1 Tax=Rhodococcus aetherivorans TaxID=191292 RepID=UPI00366FC1DF